MQKLFFFLSLSFLVACGGKRTEEKTETTTVTDSTHNENSVALSPEQALNAGIAIGKPGLQSMSSLLKVSGQVEVPPQNMVTISVPMGGYLQQTALLPGMFVRKGQVLALIQDQQYIQMQQDYLTARARMTYLQKEYERQRELNQSKAVSDKQFQQAEAEFRTQQVSARALEARLRLIHIDPARLSAGNISGTVRLYAPISGYVSKVNVSMGKYVAPSDILFEIINPNDIHLALTVFEKDVNKLRIGQKVLAYSNTNPEKKYNCKITLINRDLAADRSAEVHCHFEQFDKDLVPGMFMNAEIEQYNEQAYVLPEEAVVSFEKQQFVFVQTAPRTYDLVAVETGTVQEGKVALQPVSVQVLQGKPVVIKGAYSLLMKLKNSDEE
jgi:membrane fusion protein, heavy metal efflux system